MADPTCANPGCRFLVEPSLGPADPPERSRARTDCHCSKSRCRQVAVAHRNLENVSSPECFLPVVPADLDSRAQSLLRVCSNPVLENPDGATSDWSPAAIH